MPNVKHSLISILVCASLLLAALSACAKKPEPVPSSSEPEESIYEEIAEPEPEPEPEISEPEPELEPEPEVSEPEEPESSEEEKPEPEEPKNNPFSLSLNSLTDMYVLNPSDMVYSRPYSQIASLAAEGEQFPIINAINALPRLNHYDYDKSVRYSTGFLIYDKNGKRHEYNIIPGALIADGVGYYLPQEDYDEIMSLAAQVTQESGGAQWLVRMSPSHVTGIDCVDENGESFSVKAENLQNAVRTARNLPVSGAKMFQQGSYELMGMDGFSARITFSTGVAFTMLMEDGYLYLESSDMSFGCRYNMSESAIQGFAAAMKQAA